MDVWEDALGLERWKLGSHLKVWQGERWRTQTAREDFGARPTRRQGLSGLVSYQETPPARERRGLGFRGSALQGQAQSPERGTDWAPCSLSVAHAPTSSPAYQAPPFSPLHSVLVHRTSWNFKMSYTFISSKNLSMFFLLSRMSLSSLDT